MVDVCAPSSLLSSTAATVTVTPVSQLLASNVTEVVSLPLTVVCAGNSAAPTSNTTSPEGAVANVMV